jgi:hypothetical protein
MLFCLIKMPFTHFPVIYVPLLAHGMYSSMLLSYEIADSSGGSGETPFKGVHFCNFSIGEQA